jgi:hypothetical protein
MWALKEADRTAFGIAEIQDKLVHDPGSKDAGFKERIAAGSERYRAIEEMPTWPVDPATDYRRRSGPHGTGGLGLRFRRHQVWPGR